MLAIIRPGRTSNRIFSSSLSYSFSVSHRQDVLIGDRSPEIEHVPLDLQADVADDDAVPFARVTSISYIPPPLSSFSFLR